jgi:hypothetical protein
MVFVMNYVFSTGQIETLNMQAPLKVAVILSREFIFARIVVIRLINPQLVSVQIVGKDFQHQNLISILSDRKQGKRLALGRPQKAFPTSYC